MNSKGQPQEGGQSETSDQQLYTQFICNQILQLTSFYVSFILNKNEQIQTVIKERQRQFYEKAKNDFNQEINAKYVETLFKKKVVEANLNKQIKSLQAELSRFKKETKRLENIVRDKDDEIRLLLQGDDNYERIKTNLQDLTLYMKGMESSTDHNEQQSLKIKEFNQYLMNMTLSSPRVKRARTKSLKKKNNEQSSGDESDLCRNCKKSKNRVLGKRNGGNEEGPVDGTSVIRKYFPHEDRLEYLLSVATQFMTEDEQKMLKKCFRPPEL
jgi:hypothetical protein